MRPPIVACPQCASLDCGPTRCRFSDETHASYREREMSLALMQRDIQTKGYICECPGWWNCPKRGCYEAAKLYDPGYRPAPLPGDPGYLSSSSRDEARINQAVYYGGPLGKRHS